MYYLILVYTEYKYIPSSEAHKNHSNGANQDETLKFFYSHLIYSHTNSEDHSSNLYFGEKEFNVDVSY